MKIVELFPIKHQRNVIILIHKFIIDLYSFIYSMFCILRRDEVVYKTCLRNIISKTL